MKLLSILLIYLIFLSSCGNVGKILRNEKINSTDEFLVKKKDPLILPPDFDKIPTPGAMSNDEDNKSEFKEIIKNNKSKKIKSKKSSSIEETILRKIPK